MAKAIDWSDLLHPDFESIEQMLTTWYVNEKLSLEAVGNRLGIHKDPVRKKLVFLGIELHAKGKPGPNNVRKEFKQAPNQPKDSAAETALKREGQRLGMRPDDYIPVETRKTEKRDCLRFDNCLTYGAILHGWTIPCYKCSGIPEFAESMERTLQVFEEQFGRTMIIERTPGVEKEEIEEPHQFHKYLEGIYFSRED